MSPERAYFAVCAALIGFALGYALPIYGHLPLVLYDPQSRQWFAGVRTAALPIGYYGQMLWGLGGAALGGPAGWLFAVARGPRSAAVGRLMGAWTLTAVSVVAAWFAWNNWP